MVKKKFDNVLMKIERGDTTTTILRKHPADVGAYRLPRIVRETNLPLKAEELRFIAESRAKRSRR